MQQSTNVNTNNKHVQRIRTTLIALLVFVRIYAEPLIRRYEQWIFKTMIDIYNRLTHNMLTNAMCNYIEQYDQSDPKKDGNHHRYNLSTI